MDLPIFQLEIDETEGSEDGVSFIAMVDRPAIKKNFLAFSEAFKFKVESEEKRIVSGPVMVADTPIYRNDERGEYYVMMNKDTIQKMMLKFFKQGNQSNINLEHDASKQVQGVTMFESWQSDSSRGIAPMKGFEDAPDGSWFGSFKIENDEVWTGVKEGKFRGVSIEGVFDMKQETKEEKLLSEVINILKQVK